MKPKSEKRKKIYQKFGGRCAYCGHLPPGLTLDHIKPVSKGGTWRLENLYPACYDCNKAKSSLSIEQFREAINSNLIKKNKHLNRHWKAVLSRFCCPVYFHFEGHLKTPKEDEVALPKYCSMGGFGCVEQYLLDRYLLF